MTDSTIDLQQAFLLTEMLTRKGLAYSTVVGGSHYDDTITAFGSQPTGNSRISGDADLQTQLSSIDAITSAASAAGLSTHDTAYVLAIAREESGFNPDAAAGTSSASGLGQFIDATGSTYGLDSSNRWDVTAQATALVNEFIDLKAQVTSNSQSEDYIYAYHHDGASSSDPSVGLALSDSSVMPEIATYEYYLNSAATAGVSPSSFWPTDLPTASSIAVTGTHDIPLNACVLPSTVTGALTPWASAPHEGSPLIIDLSSGHTGIELTTFDASTTSTFFDIEGTGYAVQTAWTSGDTSGFLVDDLNSNGKIDSVSEMFGSTTVDGFAQLAKLDSNHDLKIDSHDAAWSSLQVWIDAFRKRFVAFATGGDGITDSDGGGSRTGRARPLADRALGFAPSYC